MNWMIRTAALMATAALIGIPATTSLAQDATPVAAHPEIEITYVLFGLNSFTDEMVTGAQDAARDYGVTLEVSGDASFDVTAQIAAFESALASGADGIAVAPLDGDQWVAPIQAAIDADVSVVGFNVTAFGSALSTWVGQDDFDSGRILGSELLNHLAATGVDEGEIAVGSCNPGETVLADREAGLRQAFAGTEFDLLAAQDVHLTLEENASAWEAVVSANPEVVAAVGLCYIDVPNLAQIKERTGSTWLIGGYNPDPLTLETVASGQAQVIVGQQEYLQGYLPVAILAEHLINGTSLVEGWLELPTEVVTAENVALYLERETDDRVQYDYYQAYIAEHFGDLQAAARPYDDLRTLGDPPGTPAP